MICDVLIGLFIAFVIVYILKYMHGSTMSNPRDEFPYVHNLGYKTYITRIKHGKGYWDTLEVAIHDSDNNKLGSYTYNYHHFRDTLFYPFEQDGKRYALYSTDYTATRVMELPSCNDVAGETDSILGFCPVEFFVPLEGQGKFGFMAGCVWGDDNSWKVRFLDLSRVSEGVLKCDDRFGYLELPRGVDLKDAVDTSWYDPEDEYPTIAIAKVIMFRVDGTTGSPSAFDDWFKEHGPRDANGNSVLMPGEVKRMREAWDAAYDYFMNGR